MRGTHIALGALSFFVAGCGLAPASWLQALTGEGTPREERSAAAPAAETAAAGEHAHAHPKPGPAAPRRVVPEGAMAPLFDDLGDFHRPVTTSSELAQRYFDQGMILTYGFNHAEAIRSFQEAQRLDPVCAMCFWGEAYAYGPNINAPMEESAVAPAWAALARARATMGKATPVERALIEALAERYVEEPVADRTPLDRAYANAMREVAKSFPEDDDVQVLFAEALMDTIPWDYYESPDQPRPETVEVIDALERVMKRSPDHAGAIHFYIHAVEPTSTAGRAEAAADRLRGLVPGAGHLVHMPGHIYLKIGRYHDATIANVKAAQADESYISQCRAQGFYPAAYYPHNVHFLWTAATFEGRSELAIDSARKLIGLIPDEMIDELALLEELSPTLLFALVRFGHWEEILEQPRPPEKRLYTTGMWHYAHGMAKTALGKTDEATEHLAALETIGSDDSFGGVEFLSFATPSALLGIAADVLAARLAVEAGDLDEAITRLERAVAVQDGLRYTEPPPWHFPVRDALGATLLKAGRNEEAVAVYRAQLEKTPRSGWTLSGLVRALRRSGDEAAAAEAEQALRDAWQYADIDLESSIL